MTMILIIAGVLAALYLFGAVSFHYGFKNFPM